MHLLQAADEEKDQSYYLYALDQTILSKVLFPLGAIQKQDVFKLAQKYEVPMSDSYRESQDLCFFPEKDPSAFLERYLPDIQEGDIQTEDGETIGTHRGLPFYTIGQRKGLGIGGLKIPLHVKRKEPSTNTIIVAPDGEDCNDTLDAVDIQWVHTAPKSPEMNVYVRINSLGEKLLGTLNFKGNSGSFHFKSPVRGIADDQAIVFYEGDEVLGGGRICQVH